MELALENVRNLALIHKEELVELICSDFVDVNGREPTINDLSAIFGRIRDEFAEEATEDYLEQNGEFEDSEDSDYDEFDIDDNQQVLNDLEEDYFEESEGSEDSEDSDYDENDAEDLQQVQEDQDEDYFSSEDEEIANQQNQENEDEENANWVFGADEETIINSESFDNEYFAAIECARNQAVIDKEQLFETIKERYSEETGQDATNEMVQDAFYGFVESEYDESDESENEQQETVEIEQEDEAENESENELFLNEMDLALQHVRKLAAKQQEEFVNTVCEIFGDSNGFEPSLPELYAIFDGVKEKFADEARGDFLEDLDEDSFDDEESEEESEDDKDSDYDPNDAEDIKQVADDLDEDYSEDQSEESHEEQETLDID